MTPTNSNFYQIGASLPVDAPSYVKRQADEEFYQKLRAGKFCYVLNSRQMGKSSLRVQTMQRLQKQGTICAAIDLTGIGNVTQQQWYGGIVYNLSESCQLEDKFDFDWQEWWQKHQTILSPVQCLSLFIEKVLLAKIQQPIVIFVDEIDKVLSQDFSLDDFFALIRFFQNQRVDNPIFQRLTFALLGVATPGDLIENKTQTPFNIGEAIELHGFKFDEVEPLIKGLREKCDRPQVIMTEILDWTGGQPFLTQKLCKFMVEESAASRKSKVKSQKSKVDENYSVLVREVVNKRIIENWESQDDPEHLRTIRDRILSSEQRAGYLLELYQQIQQQGEVAANKNLESSELRLSGLVVQREGKLRVYNRVYQQVFNQNWVETQLKNLRPYSEAFRFWVASGYSDESRLLQGKALVDAEEWAKDKNLGYEDKQFVAASREKEIAVRNKEAELEREGKDREAAEKRNLVLSEANIKAKRRIRNGTVVLVLALLGAVSLGVFAAREGYKLASVKKNVETVQSLSELAGELRNENLTAESDEALRQAGLSFRVNDHNLKQAMLLASMSQAYQSLANKDETKEQKDKNIGYQKKAENNLAESLKYLNKQGNNTTSSEGLQIKVLVKANQGKLFVEKSKQKAINAYSEAFYILKKYPTETNPFVKDKILTTEDIESVHRELLKLQSYHDQEVWNSLKEHFYAKLENFLKSKNWSVANGVTDTLMDFIADGEREIYPEVRKFYPEVRIKGISYFCEELKQIDKLWVNNSSGYFGFSVQKKILVETGNKIVPEGSSDIDNLLGFASINNLLRFASVVGWYNNKREDARSGSEGWVSYEDIFSRDLGRESNRETIRGKLPIQMQSSIYSGTDIGMDLPSDSALFLGERYEGFNRVLSKGNDGQWPLASLFGLKHLFSRCDL